MKAIKGYRDDNNSKEGKNILQTDLITVAKHHSAIQLCLENTKFKENNMKKRYVVLMRTESSDVIGDLKPGDRCKHKTGIAESHSIFETSRVFGDCLTMVKVPYSRINGLFFISRKSREYNPFFNSFEYHEVNADTRGLDIVYIKSGTWRGEPIADHIEFFEKALKKIKDRID